MASARAMEAAAPSPTQAEDVEINDEGLSKSLRAISAVLREMGGEAALEQ